MTNQSVTWPRFYAQTHLNKVFVFVPSTFVSRPKSLYTNMSDTILHENVPKFITDVAGFLENDDNNDRIQQLQKGELETFRNLAHFANMFLLLSAAHKMQVQLKQNELKLQQEYLKTLRESVKDIPGFWPFTLVSPSYYERSRMLISLPVSCETRPS